MGVVAFLWKFKEPLLVLAVILLVGGHWLHYKSLKKQVDKLEAQLTSEKAAHKQTREDWAAEALKWHREKEQQVREFEAAKKKKEEIVKKNRKNFNEVFK